MKDILILSDGTNLDLESFSSIEDLRITASDKQSTLETWDKFTPDNLTTIEIQSPDGTTIGKYIGLRLISTTSYIQDDGIIMTSYKLTGRQIEIEPTEKTEV